MKNNIIWRIVVIISLIILAIFAFNALKQKKLNDTNPEVSNMDLTALENPEIVIPKEGKEIIPRTSPVSDENEVLTMTGEKANNAALPGASDAPIPSHLLTAEDLPENSVKLTVVDHNFIPNEFTVKAGEVVTLSFTSGDTVHVLKFDNPEIQAIALGIGLGETKAIVFNAPVVGDYTFFCDVPGHQARGETGVMHVE
jgi:heme/copper-type cytochrome/quinol oxidase subunit 2